MKQSIANEAANEWIIRTLATRLPSVHTDIRILGRREIERVYRIHKATCAVQLCIKCADL